MSKRILFTDVYPYTPGKMDAIVIISLHSITLPQELVLLPPYPTAEVFEEEFEFYRTPNVTRDELPEGIDAIEISPESFIALNSENPNKPGVPTKDEIATAMSKEEILGKRDWNSNIFSGEESDDEDTD